MSKNVSGSGNIYYPRGGVVPDKVLRYNTDTGEFEAYVNNIWAPIKVTNLRYNTITQKIEHFNEGDNNWVEVDFDTDGLEHARNVTSKITIDNDDTLVTDGNLTVNGRIVSYVPGDGPVDEPLALFQIDSNVTKRFTIENVGGGAAMYRMISRPSPGASANGDWGINTSTGHNGALTFYNYDTNQTRFIISNTGNVGISHRTTNPSAKLYVDGTLRVTGIPHFGSPALARNSVANAGYFTGNSGNDRVVIQSTNGNAVIRLMSGLIDITSDWGWSANSSGHFGMYQYSDETSGTWIMSANAEGNIGIGTTEPTAKLDVDGTTRLRQGLMIDGLDEGYLYLDSDNQVTTTTSSGPDVDHAITVTNRFAIDNNTLETDDNLTVNGTTRLGGTVQIDGNTTLNSNLSIAGNVTINNQFTLNSSYPDNNMNIEIMEGATIMHFYSREQSLSNHHQIRCDVSHIILDETVYIDNSESKSVWVDGRLDIDEGLSSQGKIVSNYNDVDPGIESHADISTNRYYLYQGETVTGAVGRSADGTISTAGASSDIRLKSNVKPLKETVSSSLDVIDNIETYTYEHELFPGKDKTGFIADQLMTHVPEAVDGKKYAYDFEKDEEGNFVKDSDGEYVLSNKPRYKTIDLVPVVAHLVESVKELKQLVSDQQDIINRLTSDIE